jgi:DnaJ-class molecular chaperone
MRISFHSTPLENEDKIVSVCDMENCDFYDLQETDDGYMFLIDCFTCQGSGEVEIEDDYDYSNNLTVKICWCCGGRGERWLHIDKYGKLI